MVTTDGIPAAQYLRMSTDHQQYSLENQSAAIESYANLHGFVILRTYADAARSGVILKHRSGLQRLLADVVSGNPQYRAILVYDVSRWGRFQDTDEAAHYEFLCKSAGAPVHYCAETFPNDGTIPSLIMKALKRAMAGEYSRELGVKVFAGQKRLAELGFKLGGRAGYGLRRMLVSSSKKPKQLLAFGERKSIASDRVILVPGPDEEVHHVREIFRMLVSEKRTVHSIACELNRRGVPYFDSKWDYQAVYSILTHPKYAGFSVFARSSRKLYSPTIKLPKSQWVVTPGAFQPLVDIETFNRAQEVLEARTINRTDEELLDELRKVLTVKGRLSLRLIHNSPDTPSPSTYRHRFGGLRRTYDLIGYGHSDQFKNLDLRHRTSALREELINRIVRTCPGKVSTVKKSGRWRTRLRLPSRMSVSILIARSLTSLKHCTRWQVDPHPAERHNVTLLARLTQDNDAFLDFYVFSRIQRKGRFRISLADSWLKSGVKLGRLEQFCELAEKSGKLRTHRSRDICPS
jgi:DNA invertase Pin-like site-specific DNA recombinase